MKKILLLGIIGMGVCQIFASDTGSEQVIPHTPEPLSFSDTVTLLYQESLMLFLSSEQLKQCSTPADFKALCDRAGLIATDSFLGRSTITPWNNEEWQEAYGTLNTYTQRLPLTRKDLINPNLAPQLLSYAKTILSSFVLPNGLSPQKTKAWKSNWEIYTFGEKRYLRKDLEFRRLFTYKKLQSIIQDHGLTHVHLPQKFLVIQDKTTGLFITGDEAIAVIAKNFHLFLRDTMTLRLFVDFINPENRYDIFILAEEQIPSKKTLNLETAVQLGKLILQAPFDVGRDNIFTTETGDAVIIDTENKGEHSFSCFLKLLRYVSEDYYHDFAKIFKDTLTEKQHDRLLQELFTE